jgi:hypothetical protein
MVLLSISGVDRLLAFLDRVVLRLKDAEVPVVPEPIALLPPLHEPLDPLPARQGGAPRRPVGKLVRTAIFLGSGQLLQVQDFQDGQIGLNVANVLAGGPVPVLMGTAFIETMLDAALRLVECAEGYLVDLAPAIGYLQRLQEVDGGLTMVRSLCIHGLLASGSAR